MTQRRDRRGLWTDIRSRKSLGVSWLDVKMGIRMMGREPLLTAVAVITLAIGIPTALSPAHILGLFESTFPVDDGHRIVALRNWDTESNGPWLRLLHDFEAWKAELTSFQQLAATRPMAWNVHSPDGRAGEVLGAEVSAEAFAMMRVPPLMGRHLLESDEAPEAPRVAVIGEAIWTSRFGRDPDIVGKQVRIGRIPHTVVGVMPGDFLFPLRNHLWVPLRLRPIDYEVGGGPGLAVYGRLADGVSIEEADAELAVVGEQLAAEWPETHERLRPETVNIALHALGMPASGMSDSVEWFMVQGFALLLLFVALGNVGTMILARTAARLNEFAVRTALGASRARIVSQLFVESLVMALVATGIGLVLADQVIRQIAAYMVDEMPYWFDLGLNLRSVSLALGLAAVSAVGAGVFPALKATSSRVQENLQASGGGSTVRFGWFTTVLVVAEIGLSVGFLSMGVVAAQSALAATSNDLGVDVERYLTARYRTIWVEPTADEAEVYENEFRTRAAQNQDELRRRLAADPSVRAVAMAEHLPATYHPRLSIELEGDVGDGEGIRVARAYVHVDFFQDLGRPVLEGRAFGSGDLPEERGAHRAATVVNRSFVTQVLGGGSALGRRFRYVVDPSAEPGEWYEIVGVSEDLGMNVQNPAKGAGVYHPYGSDEIHPMRFIIDVGQAPNAFVPQLRTIASEIDPEAIIQLPQPLSEVAAMGRLEMQVGALLILSLAGIGALLAAAGLYALMAFTVAQRTREIGIRIALGAGARRVLETIARRAAFQLALGVVAGHLFGLWILDEISGDGGLVEFSAPAVLSAVTAAVVAMVGVSCLAPVLRGLRIDPTEALREG